MKKILIVDDEEEIVYFLSEFFGNRPEQYQIKTATDSKEAMKLFHSFQPDCVLLDLKMKKYDDGIQILRQIKSINKAIKVIMVTAIEDEETVKRAMQAGADDYITKPLRLENLENAVVEKLKDGPA